MPFINGENILFPLFFQYLYLVLEKGMAAQSSIFSNSGNGNPTGPSLNQLLWQNLAWLILRSYRIEGYLIGEKGCLSKFISTDLSEKSAEKQLLNPEYETWMAVDQLYSSMSPENGRVFDHHEEVVPWFSFGRQSHLE